MYALFDYGFTIDSFVKNEIDKGTVKVTFKEVEKYILSISKQIFFATISENLNYLSNLDTYHVIDLTKPLLTPEKYNRLLAEVMTK